MATSVTIPNTQGVFPASTAVKVVEVSASVATPTEGMPPGTAVEFTTSASGTLEATGLTAGKYYVAGASVSGTWKYIHFRIDPTAESPHSTEENFEIIKAGAGLRVKEGSNAKQGVSVAMVAGEVTVADTAISANSRLLLTRQAGGTHPGAVYELTRTAGTSFVVASTNTEDTGRVAYEIIEPA